MTAETAVNLQRQVDYLLEGLSMISQADSRAEAIGMAVDLIEAHHRAVAQPGATN